MSREKSLEHSVSILEAKRDDSREISRKWLTVQGSSCNLMTVESATNLINGKKRKKFKMRPSKIIEKYGWVRGEAGDRKIGFCAIGAMCESLPGDYGWASAQRD